MQLKVNINDEIRVDLTDRGWLRMDSYYQKLGISKPAKHDGKHIRIQLWEFIQIFGDMYRMGAEAPTEDNSIYFDLR